MWTYYARAERAMTTNCSADYTHITNYVDSVLTNGTMSEIDELKIALYTAVQSGPGGHKPVDVNRTAAEAMTNIEVGYNLLTPLSFYQYYGFEASVQPFCDLMETFNQTHVRTTDNAGTAPAIAAESGIAVTHNVTAAWNAFLVGISELGYGSIPSKDDPIQDYSWMWQYCSEYGYCE